MASSPTVASFTVADCPIHVSDKPTLSTYPSASLLEFVMDPPIEPGSSTASRSLALAEESAYEMPGPVPIDSHPGGYKFAYGFVIDWQTRSHWALQMNAQNDPPLFLIEDAKTESTMTHMLIELEAALDKFIPFKLSHTIKGVPRFQSKNFSRLVRLATVDGYLYAVKHNACQAALDVQVPQKALDELRVALGVPDQEPAWHLVTTY